MLLSSYRKKIFRAKCNPGFESLHCIAHLDQNVGDCLPYLNAELGGFEYIREPPSVTFKVHGRLITIHPDKIAVNALEDETQADKILEWLKNEINETWDRRAEITPQYDGQSRPKVIEILKLLLKTNCRKCGQATCLVFASLAVEGVVGADDCPALEEENKKKLQDYLGEFNFDT